MMARMIFPEILAGHFVRRKVWGQRYKEIETEIERKKGGRQGNSERIRKKERERLGNSERERKKRRGRLGNGERE